MKKIAIVGRPNVGKSTLFNRLVGRRVALVHPQPGMTRDRREETAHLYSLTFSLMDTAGLAEPDESALSQSMYQKTIQAAEQADLILFVFDAREGVLPLDQDLAKHLRRLHKPIVVLGNKAEGNHDDWALSEGARLGLGEVIPLSAEHGIGLGDLYQALCPFFPQEEEEEEKEGKTEKPKISSPIQVAVVGRPNVGKSTLVNRLIGEDRLLTANMPGVTRDSIRIGWSYGGIPFELIDTAGIRRRGKITSDCEKLAVYDTDRSIQFCHVAILVVDSTQPFEHQDLSIAADLAAQGRVVVVALNKWDLVPNPSEVLKGLQQMMESSLSQLKGLSLIPISAQYGRHLDRLMDGILESYTLWTRRLSTATLNKWLTRAVESHSPPLVKGRRLKLKYITQIKSRPPTFVLFSSQEGQCPQNYLAYLTNRLREDFHLWGIPLRMTVKTSPNPYAGRPSRKS